MRYNDVYNKSSACRRATQKVMWEHRRVSLPVVFLQRDRNDALNVQCMCSRDSSQTLTVHTITSHSILQLTVTRVIPAQPISAALSPLLLTHPHSHSPPDVTHTHSCRRQTVHREYTHTALLFPYTTVIKITVSERTGIRRHSIQVDL